MEQKKKTLKSRVNDSLIFIEKDKEYLSVDFKDKGIKIDITEDYAIISTTFHKHIFESMTGNGISETYLLLKHFVQIALSCNCTEKDENGIEYTSYKKLNEMMGKEDVTREDRLIFEFCDMWLYNIYQPLHTLQSNEVSSFVVYMNYISNLANVSVLLEENKEPLTTVKYIEKYTETIRELTKDLTERVLFEGGNSDNELTDKLTKTL